MPYRDDEFPEVSEEFVRRYHEIVAGIDQSNPFASPIADEIAEELKLEMTPEDSWVRRVESPEWYRVTAERWNKYRGTEGTGCGCGCATFLLIYFTVPFLMTNIYVDFPFFYNHMGVVLLASLVASFAVLCLLIRREWRIKDEFDVQLADSNLDAKKMNKAVSLQKILIKKYRFAGYRGPRTFLSDKIPMKQFKAKNPAPKNDSFRSEAKSGPEFPPSSSSENETK